MTGCTKQLYVVNIAFRDDSEKLVLGDPERFAVDSPTPGINVVEFKDAMVHGATMAATPAEFEDGIAPGTFPSLLCVRHSPRIRLVASNSKFFRTCIECTPVVHILYGRF